MFKGSGCVAAIVVMVDVRLGAGEDTSEKTDNEAAELLEPAADRSSYVNDVDEPVVRTELKEPTPESLSSISHARAKLDSHGRKSSLLFRNALTRNPIIWALQKTNIPEQHYY